MMEIGDVKGDLAVVPVMDEIPGCCAFCGRTPMDEENNPLPAIKVVGIDFNWGDTVYVCYDCSNVICDLTGRVALDEHEKLRDKYKFAVKRLRREVEYSRKLTEAAQGVAAGDKHYQDLESLIKEKS